ARRSSRAGSSCGSTSSAGTATSSPRGSPSNVSQDAEERSRHPSEVERLDEQARVAGLAAAAAPHEAVELLLDRPPAPRRLLPERAERPELALRSHDLLHRGGPERAD